MTERTCSRQTDIYEWPFRMERGFGLDDLALRERAGVSKIAHGQTCRSF
jgi:hypothetical protein